MLIGLPNNLLLLGKDLVIKTGFLSLIAYGIEVRFITIGDTGSFRDRQYSNETQSPIRLILNIYCAQCIEAGGLNQYDDGSTDGGENGKYSLRELTWVGCRSFIKI